MGMDQQPARLSLLPYAGFLELLRAYYASSKKKQNRIDQELTKWSIAPLIDWLLYRLNGLLIDRSIDWLIDYFIDWMVYWSIDWLIDWLIDDYTESSKSYRH